ncbi:uncharacterized protein [Euphorbia lathyris]|uniref:uncharacterized protein isoform X1 n=1 Tax=Euphorbia lathyris TaxID=212925 RepID=UPI003313AE97
MALSLSTKSYLSSAHSKSLSRIFALRFQSTLPSHPNHTDLSDDSTSTDPLLRKLEDAIHRIIVRRAAPDWLPFLPGSSYWVPPPRSADGSNGIAQLIEKLANPLTDEETLSTTSVRGWPSSDYFIKGVSFSSTNVKASPTKSEAKASLNKSEAEAKASSNESEAVATSSTVFKSEDEEG